MSDLILRDAREGDRGAIRDITLAAYEQYASMMLPEHWREYRQNILETLAAVTPDNLIVAEQDGAVVGSIIFYPQGESPDESSSPSGSTGERRPTELRLLAVPPSERGRGIGRALMDESVRRARELGAPLIEIYTTELMQVGKRMYEKMGFRRVPERDWHPAPDFVVMCYHMTLSP